MRLTIGKKLTAILAGLLVSSVTSVVLLSNQLFTEDNTALIQRTNADAASSLAAQIRQIIEPSLSTSRLLAGLLLTESEAAKDTPLFHSIFHRTGNLLGLILHKKDAQQNFYPVMGIAAPQTLEQENASFDLKLPGTKLKEMLSKSSSVDLVAAAQGAPQVHLVSWSENEKGLALTAPLGQETNEASLLLTVILRQSALNLIFGESDVATSFLVGPTGQLLSHSDAQRAQSLEDLSPIEIVRQLRSGKFNNGQTRYMDPTSGVVKLGAFRMVGFGGLAVVTEVPEAKAFEAAERVRHRAMLVGGAVLCLSFLLGYLFSHNIVTRIRLLVRAARRISEGDFKVQLIPKEKDELAQLAIAFNEMAHGLAERDRVKETFQKFHSKEIADKLMSGEVTLGGDHLESTVLFTDLRGFTSLSEKMNPEDVVEMLNEYLTRMVSVIRRHGGVVDKYVGDAIMALWGVPLKGQRDTQNAVHACLAMRQELKKLNEERAEKGLSELRMGMGLNHGVVIAGNIGSNEKMEYTVIGDTVNLASRIESLTKELKTDLLISTTVYERVRTEFTCEELPGVTVKGKADLVQVFKVLEALPRKKRNSPPPPRENPPKAA